MHRRGGCSFLRALLDKATEALARGERVTIAGIGTFAPGEPSQEAVVWAPDPLLAEAVNEPLCSFGTGSTGCRSIGG